MTKPLTLLSRRIVERSLMLLGAAAVASAIVAHTSSEQPQIPTYISDAAW
jgi:hypothetical protein